MASFIQKTEYSDASPGAGVTVSIGSVTSGHTVFLIINWGNGSGAGSGNVVSVSGGGYTWNRLGSTIYTPNSTFGGFGGEVWWALATASIPVSVSISLSASFSYHRVASAEYSGIVSPYVDPNVSNPATNTGTGTALTSGTLTTTDTDVLIELAFWNSGSTMASSSGFTQRIAGTNGSAIQDNLANHIPSSHSFSGTLSGSADWASFLVGAVVPSSHFIQQVNTIVLYPSSTGTITSPSITITSGNWLVVHARMGAGSGAISNCRDTLSNTYHNTVQGNPGPSTANALFWSPLGESDTLFWTHITTGGATQVSVDFGNTGTYSSLVVMEFNGISGVPEGWIANTASATNPSEITTNYAVSPTSTQYLTVAMFGCDGTSNITGATTFTDELASGQLPIFVMGEQVNASSNAGGITASITSSGSCTYIAVALVFPLGVAPPPSSSKSFVIILG